EPLWRAVVDVLADVLRKRASLDSWLDYSGNGGQAVSERGANLRQKKFVLDELTILIEQVPRYEELVTWQFPGLKISALDKDAGPSDFRFIDGECAPQQGHFRVLDTGFVPSIAGTVFPV